MESKTDSAGSQSHSPGCNQEWPWYEHEGSQSSPAFQRGPVKESENGSLVIDLE